MQPRLKYCHLGSPPKFFISSVQSSQVIVVFAHHESSSSLCSYHKSSSPLCSHHKSSPSLCRRHSLSRQPFSTICNINEQIYTYIRQHRVSCVREDFLWEGEGLRIFISLLILDLLSLLIYLYLYFCPKVRIA